MATIKRFEDLDCWQAGRGLKQQVYRLTRKPEFSRDLPLVSQIRRAACSVTSNVVEGFERNGNREFISFLSIASYKLAEHAGRLIGAFMRYLEQSELKGRKFVRTRGSTTQNPEL